MATAVKLLPLPMFAAALTDRRARLTAVAPACADRRRVGARRPAGVGGLRDDPAEHPADRDGIAASRTSRLRTRSTSSASLGLGLLIGWVLALGFGIAAVITGMREGYSNRVMAMAVFSVTFASSTLWDHYLAVLAPLILWAWPAGGDPPARCDRGLRRASRCGLWTQIGRNPEYRARAAGVSHHVQPSRSRPFASQWRSRQVAWARLPVGST